MKFQMKTGFALLTLTLAVTVAEATPALQDKAVFTVTLEKELQDLTGKATFELTAYDKTSDTWTQTSLTDFAGEQSFQTKSVPAAKLLNDAAIDDILKNCAAKGGKNDIVHSLAGHLPACAMPVSNTDSTGTVWVSKVPFGYSKWVTVKDGLTTKATIESFVNGPKN
jgi:hypothetical protein